MRKAKKMQLLIIVFTLFFYFSLFVLLAWAIPKPVLKNELKSFLFSLHLGFYKVCMLYILFLTAILHRGLRNHIFLVRSHTFFSMFYLDFFHFPFLFELLFSFFISFFYLDFYFPFLSLLCSIFVQFQLSNRGLILDFFTNFHHTFIVL